MNQRQRKFGANYDSSKVPGYSTRFKSLDGLVGGKSAQMDRVSDENAPNITMDKNFRGKVRTGTNIFTLPSQVFRKQGHK